MIEILIADDHRVFREGIASLLAEETHLKIIGEAGSGQEVLQYLQMAQPDVILMDISMENGNGIETTKIIKNQYPEIKILVLSMHDESDYIIRVLDAGADSYILKDAGSDELIKAIEIVHSGDTYYSQEVSQHIIQYLKGKRTSNSNKKGVPISKREYEILKLIAEENSNAEIADQLFISVRTVETHKRNIIEKLEVKNTVGLVKYALKHGIIEV